MTTSRFGKIPLSNGCGTDDWISGQGQIEPGNIRQAWTPGQSNRGRDALFDVHWT